MSSENVQESPARAAGASDNGRETPARAAGASENDQETPASPARDGKKNEHQHYHCDWQATEAE